MNKASNCKTCKTDSHLKWKTISHTMEWWIHCDKCGQEGPARNTQQQAGEAWNKEQEKS